MFAESAAPPLQDIRFECSFEERKRDNLLACRLAIAEKDLLRAQEAGDMNAIERAIRDVNRFRARSGLPCVPKLPAHVRDRSLQMPIGRLPNGSVLYHRGFGFEVGQSVVWQPAPGYPSRTGTAVQIFEYGRNPIVVFKPDDGVPFWASPFKLQPLVNELEQLMEPSIARSPAALRAAADLLIMPCSGMKLDRPAPAGELYTGVMWQSLRAYFRATGLAPTCMAIISAKHGIVLPDQVIEPYEQRMDEARAQELRRQAAEQAQRLAPLLDKRPARDVVIAGGRLYRGVALDVLAALKHRGLVEQSANVRCTEGGIGTQRAQLTAFLRASA